jgi:hypothetical protein
MHFIHRAGVRRACGASGGGNAWGPAPLAAPPRSFSSCYGFAALQLYGIQQLLYQLGRHPVLLVHVSAPVD